MSENNNVVVVLTTGKQDRGTRATLAFAWACTALAMGKNVTMYLTMDGTIWAMKGATKGLQVEGFEPLDQYLEQFVLLGGGNDGLRSLQRVLLQLRHGQGPQDAHARGQTGGVDNCCFKDWPREYGGHVLGTVL